MRAARVRRLRSRAPSITRKCAPWQLSSAALSGAGNRCGASPLSELRTIVRPRVTCHAPASLHYVWLDRFWQGLFHVVKDEEKRVKLRLSVVDRRDLAKLASKEERRN